jgi:hypothetical protein
MADDEIIQFPQSDATTGFGVAIKSTTLSPMFAKDEIAVFFQITFAN